MSGNLFARGPDGSVHSIIGAVGFDSGLPDPGKSISPLLCKNIRIREPGWVGFWGERFAKPRFCRAIFHGPVHGRASLGGSGFCSIRFARANGQEWVLSVA